MSCIFPSFQAKKPTQPIGGVQRGFVPLWLTHNFSAAVAIAKNCVVSTTIFSLSINSAEISTGKKKTFFCIFGHNSSLDLVGLDTFCNFDL